jgi:hypothetical protein
MDFFIFHKGVLVLFFREITIKKKVMQKKMPAEMKEVVRQGLQFSQKETAH